MGLCSSALLCDRGCDGLGSFVLPKSARVILLVYLFPSYQLFPNLHHPTRNIFVQLNGNAMIFDDSVHGVGLAYGKTIFSAVSCSKTPTKVNHWKSLKI